MLQNINNRNAGVKVDFPLSSKTSEAELQPQIHSINTEKLLCYSDGEHQNQIQSTPRPGICKHQSGLICFIRLSSNILSRRRR